MTYSLSPAVAGLSFNATTRVLSGTPTTVGSYGMAYTARDADGDIATLRFTITVAGSGSFAPADEQAFNSLVVGNRLKAETFFTDFVSSGRFIESGGRPGSYSYANTGPDTGTLTLTYDRADYGGACTILLTFASATTGSLHFTCRSGIEGRENWSVSAIGTCEPRANFRVNYSDERLTLRWSPLSDMSGYARVLGYETEIRRGANGAWSDRRTFLGRNIDAMIYARAAGEPDRGPERKQEMELSR